MPLRFGNRNFFCYNQCSFGGCIRPDSEDPDEKEGIQRFALCLSQSITYVLATLFGIFV
jgi:hypothetical protein